MDIDLLGSALGPPLTAAVREVSHQSLLPGIHRDRQLPAGQEERRRSIKYSTISDSIVRGRTLRPRLTTGRIFARTGYTTLSAELRVVRVQASVRSGASPRYSAFSRRRLADIRQSFQPVLSSMIVPGARELAQPHSRVPVATVNLRHFRRRRFQTVPGKSAVSLQFIGCAQVHQKVAPDGGPDTLRQRPRIMHRSHIIAPGFIKLFVRHLDTPQMQVAPESYPGPFRQSLPCPGQQATTRAAPRRKTSARAAQGPLRRFCLKPRDRATAHRRITKLMADAGIRDPQICPRGCRRARMRQAAAAGHASRHSGPEGASALLLARRNPLSQIRHNKPGRNAPYHLSPASHELQRRSHGRRSPSLCRPLTGRRPRARKHCRRSLGPHRILALARPLRPVPQRLHHDPRRPLPAHAKSRRRRSSRPPASPSQAILPGHRRVAPPLPIATPNSRPSPKRLQRYSRGHPPGLDQYTRSRSFLPRTASRRLPNPPSLRLNRPAPGRTINAPSTCATAFTTPRLSSESRSAMTAAAPSPTRNRSTARRRPSCSSARSPTTLRYDRISGARSPPGPTSAAATPASPTIPIRQFAWLAGRPRAMQHNGKAPSRVEQGWLRNSRRPLVITACRAAVNDA